MRFYSRAGFTEYHKGRAWVLFALYMGLIFFLSHQPGDPNKVPPFPHFDKFEHFIAYFVFATLLQRALYYSNIRRGMMAITLVAAIVYGISDEIHQSFIPNRQADFMDLIADTIGACFGILTFQAMIPRDERDPLYPGALPTKPEGETSTEA
jgi:VanZ family protein